MPVLHINDQQYPLAPGSTSLGAPDAAEIPVAAGVGVQAIVDVEEGTGATVRRAAPDANIRVNGVALGAEPTPLLHGDRLEIGGVEIRYADDRKGGATQFVSSENVADMAARRGGAVATSGTGGRLVSLVDGKEYTIPATGLVIGREVGADVVVPLAEVSRRHAEIVPTADGYRLTDLSTNGVMVNGVRVEQSRVLTRSDIIRVGAEEFRFYADVAKAVAAPPAAASIGVPAPTPIAAPVMPPDSARVGVPARTSDAPGAPALSSAIPSSAAPLTAAPSSTPAPTRRPAPAPVEPTPAPGGRRPVMVWLLLVLAIVAAAFFVTG